MKKKIIPFLILTFSAFAAGCGSDAVTNSEVNTANTSEQNIAQNINETVNSSNVSSNSSAAANSPANNSTTPVIPPKTLSDIKPLTQTAPDNSEITTALGENLVRTRTFKNHPQISKVEETTLTAENNRKIIKVYLKNGKVRETPENKINDAMTETAENILKAAG